jgi:hypothetical protein
VLLAHCPLGRQQLVLVLLVLLALCWLQQQARQQRRQRLRPRQQSGTRPRVWALVSEGAAH